MDKGGRKRSFGRKSRFPNYFVKYKPRLMDKLQEKSKRLTRILETRLKSIERENDEHLKMINESKKLILNQSQQEADELENQLEFLQLVNQNNMSKDKLHEAFEEQISLAEKHWESLQEKKAHIEEAVNNLFKLWNLLIKNRKEGDEAVKSYFEFLCSEDQIITEEMLSQTAFHYKNSKFQTIADLELSISEVQKDKEALVTKKEKLEEILKEKNRQEAMLLDSRRRLEVFGEPSASGLVLSAEKSEEIIDPVDDHDLLENIKTAGSDENCQQGSVKPVLQIIQIDDSSTEVSCYSEGGEAEILSGVSNTQCDVMGKGIRKQPRQLRTRCSQKLLSSFLSNLTAEKRRVMENSIFKPFLSIPPRSICLPLLQAFIERYDLNSDSFIIDKQAMQFCGKEVESCLGIANKGKLVDFTTQVRRTPEIFERYFGVKGKMLKEDLMEKLKHMHVNKDNADDFFRLSVYFMFSVYFFSTNDACISYWPVRYLESLELFKSFNWARAIYKYLRESVRKTANGLAKDVTTFISMKGCLPLLETLIYGRIGSPYLKMEVDPKMFSHPCIIMYTKGDSRNPSTIRRVLAKIKFDKIKECEDCSKEEATFPESVDASGL